MSQSVWSESGTLPQFHTLEGDIRTDVLIIGGGLCGILCAYFLKLAGVDYVLVEGDIIGSGTTKNTTAKITSQHGLIYDRLMKSSGREAAFAYLWANEKALEQYRILAETIDCDFEQKDAYVYTLTDPERIERETEAVNTLGFPAEFVETVSLPLEVRGAVRFPAQAQFHPLKFLAGIAKDLNIYEHTFIRELEPKRARSDRGSVTADQIIVTTHFPFLNQHGSYFLKLYQHRSYELALRGTQSIDGMYLDEAQGGLSFREYKDLLLVGGGSHRTGKPGGGWQELREFSRLCFPSAAEAYRWAAQDCMSLDGIPYIGRYSRHTPGLYVASGFNKWGMTSSMAAAMMLQELVMGRRHEWETLFSPSRSILKPQLFWNGAEAAWNLLTPSLKRCPHLGCALKWNPQEHTWDCPCHGSRFEQNGVLIDNPATGDAKIEPKI